MILIDFTGLRSFLAEEKSTYTVSDELLEYLDN